MRVRGDHMSGFTTSHFHRVIFITTFAFCLTGSVRGRDSGRVVADLASDLKERTGHGPRQAGLETAPYPPGVALEDGVARDEAVAVALWRNAGFQEDLAGLAVSAAAVREANLLANPLLTTLFPVGPKQFEFTLGIPLHPFWLRKYRGRIAVADLRRVAAEIEARGLDLARDVKLAFIELDLAASRVDLAKKQLVAAKETEDLAGSRLDLGEISGLQVVPARSQAIRAEEGQVRAIQDEEIAWQRLSGLLQLGSGATRPRLIGTPVPESVPPIETLITRGMQSRPELEAADRQLDSARGTRVLASKEDVQASLLVDANGEGLDGFEIGPGVQVTLPVFNRNEGARSRARALIEQAHRRRQAVEERIRVEIEEHHRRFERARRSLELWQGELIPALEKGLGETRAAFANGEISLIDVLEIQRQLLEARMSLVQARAEAHQSHVQLERAVGRPLATLERAGNEPGVAR